MGLSVPPGSRNPATILKAVLLSNENATQPRLKHRLSGCTPMFYVKKYIYLVPQSRAAFLEKINLEVAEFKPLKGKKEGT